MLKFLQEIATMIGPSWVVPQLPLTNPRWGTVAKLNFVKMLMSLYRKKLFVGTNVQNDEDTKNCKTAFSLQ